MNNSVFLKVIKSLSAAEFKEFDKFVNSPYFNTSIATGEVFKAVKEFYPDIDKNLPDKKSIFEIVHPGKKYNDVLMRKYISNLNKLAQQFLIVNTNRFPEYSLLRGLLNKNLYNLFLQRFGRIEKSKAEDIIDDDHFISVGLLKGELLNYYSLTDKELEYEKEKLNILEIDLLYFFYRLAQINYKRQSLAADNENSLTDYLMSGINIKRLYEKIETAKVKNKPILKFLLSLQLLQQTRDENLYRDIRTFSFEYINKYPGKTVFIGLLYLLDFITYKIEQGNYEYHRERYVIYKYEEKNRYRADTGDKITFVILRNYFNSAIRNNDIEWAGYLVEKYVKMFEAKGEEKLKKFFNAFILFYKKQYKEALASIADFNFNKQSAGDFAFTRDMRTLFLQIYFELGYIDEAFYSVDSFYHYLKHNKNINQKNRTYFGNFVKYYKELITMVSKETYSGLPKLKKNAISDKLIKKGWLLEKINELESK